MNRTRWIALGVVVACGACFLVGTVAAQEGENPGGGQMPSWMQLTKEHAEFGNQVGTWDVTSKAWMVPGQPPASGSGVATTKVILKGRFMRQDFKGSFMGMEYEGVLHVGFDTVAKEYVSTWMDSFSPYLHVARGKEHDGKLWLSGKEPTPMTGQMRRGTMSIEWTDDDTYVLTMYRLDADWTKTKEMEMTYKRRK